MKGKISSLILASILVILATLTFVSAASFTVYPASIAFNPSETSKTITITNTNSSSLLTILTSSLSITGESGYSASFNIAGNKTDINATLQRVLTISPVSSIDYSKFNLGEDYSANLLVSKSLVSNSADADDNVTIPVSIIKSFCESGDVGSGLELTRVRDENLDNTDDWKWKPLDNIEISVKVTNRIGRDIDGSLDYGLYDPDTKDFIDISEETTDFSVDDGESEDVTITFQVPADLDFDYSTKTYRFYVKAYEEDNESGLCTDIDQDDNYFQEVDVKKEKRDVIIYKLDELTSALCGETSTIKAKVYNIGRTDEERVKVNIYNKELGINLDKEFKNLDIGDSENIAFEVAVPKDASTKLYKLELTTYYDYDEDDETYGEESEEDYVANLQVEGNCQQAVIAQAASITAIPETADADIKPGTEITIKATVKNTGQEKTNYIVTLDNYQDFSTLTSINPSSLTLDAGQTQDVLIILKLSDDVSGDYTFNIKASFDNTQATQPVSLSVPKSSTGGITGSAILDSIKSNWFIWVIVLINIILIIAIIAVAIRISKA